MICLHEARSYCGSPVTIGALDLAISEGQVLHPIDPFMITVLFCPSLYQLVLGVVARGSGTPVKKLIKFVSPFILS